jgi:hypothetical protein
VKRDLFIVRGRRQGIDRIYYDTGKGIPMEGVLAEFGHLAPRLAGAGRIFGDRERPLRLQLADTLKEDLNHCNDTSCNSGPRIALYFLEVAFEARRTT